MIVEDPNGLFHYSPQGLLQTCRCGLPIEEGWSTVCAISVRAVLGRACDGCFRSRLGVAA
jgi:hypothetical protein